MSAQTATATAPLQFKRSTRAMGSGQESPAKTATTAARPTTPARRESYIKRQAVFCDVVLEDVQNNTRNGWDLPPEIASFIHGLGDVLRPPTASPAFPTTPSKSALGMSSASTRPPDPERLRCILQELLTTEVNYVARLRTLLNCYATPLRNFAHRPREEIIPAFEARNIFGNVEVILPANQSFLKELEASLNGSRREHWASTVLRHLTFFASIYPAYISNLENARKLEQAMRKKNPNFINFLDKTREILADGRDNSSLQSLLMEPMQRIPRYRLFLVTALKEIDQDDPARDDILAGMDVAGRIATLDEDEKTRRAAAMWGLNRSIENLPAIMTNSNRYFVDCIDVFDTPISRDLIPSTPGTGYSSHTQDLLCTLFLFNDVLVVARRKVIDKTGRQLVGLDNINELTKEMLGMQRSKSGGLTSPFKSRNSGNKSMEYCGKFDLGELTSADAGIHDFKIYLDHPPTDIVSDKFNDRPLRHLVVVKPETEQDKRRFLQNIWRSTAYLKAQGEKSVARYLKQDTRSIYWNFYDRRSYFKESRKAKLALQIVRSDAEHDLIVAPTGPSAIFKAVTLDESHFSYTLTVGGESNAGAARTVTHSELIRHIISQARNLRLYDAPPRLPGKAQQNLEHTSSMASNRSRAFSASSSRPRSVIDFVGAMLSPTGQSNDSTPRRTLSKASKTSSIDSRHAASIFSGEYASTAHTSIRSPSPADDPKNRYSWTTNNTSASAPMRSRSQASDNRPESPSKVEKRNWYANEEGSRSSKQLAEATSLATENENAYSKTAVAPASEDEDAIETLDQGTLSRGNSHRYLRRTGSQASIRRSRSGTLSRSASNQSMRIAEEEEEGEEEEQHDPEEDVEEILARPRTPPSVTSPVPDGLLSPRALQRSGTLSRPFGPRQLGSRSPQSPYPAYNTLPEPRQISPSPDIGDPFLTTDPNASPNASFSKKRKSDGNESDSISSKRALRDIFDPNQSSVASSRAQTPDMGKGSLRGRQDSKSARSKITGPRELAHKELQRVGSLPRSPHTRSLYQQSRTESESSLPRSSSGLASRIPRKPAPKVEEDEHSATAPVQEDDMRMEIDLVRRQSKADRAKYEKDLAVLQTENAELRRALQTSQEEVNSLKLQLTQAEEAKEREFEEVVKHATTMADEKIEEHAAILEAKVKALEAQLRNQRRAFEAQLKNRS